MLDKMGPVVFEGGMMVPPLSPLSPMCLTPALTMPHIPSLTELAAMFGESELGLFLSQRMEIVWHGEFQRLFRQYAPDVWSLMPVFEPPEQVPGLRVFKDSAKVRFSCQECGHGWTSMKGRVVFWFTLVNHYGVVMFKLYGQQCMRCKNGKYEHAMWYPEEVVKVIGNVYNRIGQLHYGFVRPPLRIDRRQGKPRNQHNADLCQACKDGLCKEEWTFS